MRLLIALSVAAAFAATAPVGFAQSTSGQQSANTQQQASTDGSTVQSNPSFYHQGGASAQPNQYHHLKNGQASAKNEKR